MSGYKLHWGFEGLWKLEAGPTIHPSCVFNRCLVKLANPRKMRPIPQDPSHTQIGIPNRILITNRINLTWNEAPIAIDSCNFPIIRERTNVPMFICSDPSAHAPLRGNKLTLSSALWQTQLFSNIPIKYQWLSAINCTLNHDIMLYCTIIFTRLSRNWLW